MSRPLPSRSRSRDPGGAPRLAPAPAGTGPLGRLAHLAVRRRGTVLLAWLVGAVLAVALAAGAAGEYEADYAAPGSDSSVAAALLTERFPAQAGQVVDVVVRAEEGTVTAPGTAAAVSRLFDRLERSPGVVAVERPAEADGTVSADGSTAAGRLRFDAATPLDVPVEDTRALIVLAESARADGLEVGLGGEVVAAAETTPLSSEVVGVAAAAVILLVALGSVVAAGLPIVVALAGVGVSLVLVPVLAAVLPIPDWSTSLAAMMGIGIGIDYVLLMLSRYRQWRQAGLEVPAATVATLDTAGRAVLLAGTTVVVSMLGLFATGLTYMRGAAVSTILTVVVVVLAALTLLPALLGYLGRHTEALALPPRRRRSDHRPPDRWTAWSGWLERHRVAAVVAGVTVLVLLALPLTTVRFGFPDAGNDPAGSPTRVAHELTAGGFGAGANAPLLLVATVPGRSADGVVDGLRDRLLDTPGVASVSPALRDPSGGTALLTVLPTTGPQDARTESLIRRLRTSVLPSATEGSGVQVHVGGLTATSMDSTSSVVDRLPVLIGGVVALSTVLLLVAFRSVVVPVKAALSNLLSVAAAYGVVAYVLQGGWAGQLLGIDQPTPLPAFIPVLMFAILFGLSMDYEVFLLSAMREAWARGEGTSRAVAASLAATGRVIVAAAAIMVVVFGAFVPTPEVFLKIIGVGLAAAVLVDVAVVRLVVVPAVMLLLGERAWWLPRWLDRWLPEVHVEGRAAVHQPAPALPAPRPALVPGGEPVRS